MLWFLYLATVYVDFIHRGMLLTQNGVDQGYTLANLKNINDTMIYYNITILPFDSFCVT